MQQSECLSCRQRGKEQRDSEKALLAGLQAEEVQLETSIAGLKRQQAALRAIGAEMVHQCDPAFLSDFSTAQQAVAKAQKAIYTCLQAVEPDNRVGGASGEQSAQPGDAKDSGADALREATDEALVRCHCSVLSLPCIQAV
jgi:hypothetical protein